MRVIRIYRWRCTDRAIEPLARHDVRCAKGPSLLAISLIYSGICWQGKNADTPFATVNPEGQASAWESWGMGNIFRTGHAPGRVE